VPYGRQSILQPAPSIEPRQRHDAILTGKIVVHRCLEPRFAGQHPQGLRLVETDFQKRRRAAASP